MSQFAYRAKKGPTEFVSGVIEASTQEEAIDRLSDQGLLPLSIEESKTGAVARQGQEPVSSPEKAKAAGARPTDGQAPAPSQAVLKRTLSAASSLRRSRFFRGSWPVS